MKKRYKRSALTLVLKHALVDVFLTIFRHWQRFFLQKNYYPTCYRALEYTLDLPPSHRKGTTFMIKLLASILVWNSLLLGTIQKQSVSYMQEELIHGQTFTHVLRYENRDKKECYFIEGKEVTPTEFEEKLYQAEKEESKKKRQQKQEERLRFHEARYKGIVKIGQKELAAVLVELTTELNRLMDERLQPFLVFSHEPFSSWKDLVELKDDQIPHAQALRDLNAQEVDIAALNITLSTMKKSVVTIKEMFLETITHALEKADDTQLLKELLTLI